jgi:hypothetical protein
MHCCLSKAVSYCNIITVTNTGTDFYKMENALIFINCSQLETIEMMCSLFSPFLLLALTSGNHYVQLLNVVNHIAYY